jgi:hypothetical protein
MASTDTTTAIRLLRRAAIIAPDPSTLEEIRRLGVQVDDWPALLTDAERHGLSNLLLGHLRSAEVPIPDEIRHQAMALKIRHRRANEIRMEALAEILQAYARRNVPCAVLKGAALVNMIYSSPEMRPMGDIDILVPAEMGTRAQNCLRDLGFSAEDRKRGALSEHHHLPAALRTDRGHQVMVEVHTDALSRDTGMALDWNTVESSMQAFEVLGEAAQAPGDIEMLRHLCHHAFEPAETFKLIALADIYGYCQNFHQRIPWEELGRRFPFVTNILTLLGCLAPPPEELRPWIPATGADCPEDAGRGYPTLTTILAREGGPWSRLGELFRAPEWWMRCYYNVAPEQSLSTTRTLRHPATVTRWLLRRLRASTRDRLRRTDR